MCGVHYQSITAYWRYKLSKQKLPNWCTCSIPRGSMCPLTAAGGAAPSPLPHPPPPTTTTTIFLSFCWIDPFEYQHRLGWVARKCLVDIFKTVWANFLQAGHSARHSTNSVKALAAYSVTPLSKQSSLQAFTQKQRQPLQTCVTNLGIFSRCAYYIK